MDLTSIELPSSAYHPKNEGYPEDGRFQVEAIPAELQRRRVCSWLASILSGESALVRSAFPPSAWTEVGVGLSVSCGIQLPLRQRHAPSVIDILPPKQFRDTPPVTMDLPIHSLESQAPKKRTVFMKSPFPRRDPDFPRTMMDHALGSGLAF